VQVSCDGDLRVRLFRPGGGPIDPSQRLVVVGMDSLLGGQMFAPVLPPGAVIVPPDAPVVREVVEDWLRSRRGRLSGEPFRSGERRLQFTDEPAACQAQ
jgi:hypothetical protein